MWERWPHQRMGERAYMRSTYDRGGHNEGAYASHFLCQVPDHFNVTLDVAGPGVLYFASYNHWHGSPWHYAVDGEDHIVQETSTADPLNPAENSVFLSEALFPNPLTWTWAITKGADLMWVPIGFEKSFWMAYFRTRYGTGYYIYKQYAPGAKLSRPIVAWEAKTPPARDVLELIARAGEDLAPPSAATPAGEATLPAKGLSEIARLETGPTMLRALEFSVPREQAIEFGRVRLRVTWDGCDHPSIDAPLSLFFGSGSLFNRDQREYLVKAFPMNIRFDDERVLLSR